MNGAANKRVVLGVSGGIAAYKSPDLVRRLRERGVEVRVVLTRAAGAFVAPLSLQAVSGHRVHQELLDPELEAAMGHIELARWADLVLVAPATANTMARLAHGLADDLLGALCLATEAPLAIAPAMNRQMWQAPATAANLQVLRARGVWVLGPAEGDQACGETGPGRMLEPLDIATAVAASFAPRALDGCRVLVTAGPTREAVDPVRFLSNHSTGKMGYAVARAAREAGAAVTLVSGPTALEAPAAVELVRVTSAAEMHEAVMARVGSAEIFVSAAAVADYRPADVSDSKIKKGNGERSLRLARTRDILADVGKLEPAPFRVGFAAETDDIERNAKAKLEGKSLDLIAANRVHGPGTGFGADDNDITVYWDRGSRALGRASKLELARDLVALIAEHYREKHPAQDPRP